jgi:L-asparagine oxygenase
MASTAAVDLPRSAHLLHSHAMEWARAGVTADDFLGRDLPVPEAVLQPLLQTLREHVVPPDRNVGTRTVRGLLDTPFPAGPTPDRWGQPQTLETRALDLAIALIALSVGSPFAWAGQQGGRLVHDIVPTRGFETMQVGASSQAPLEWHTEDAFHPERAHIIVLACLRNPDHVGSRVASIRDADLGDADLDMLRRTDAQILPDDSYHGSWPPNGTEPARGEAGAGPGVATVWDAGDGPFVRFDPAYTRFLAEDPEFRAAYDRLGASLERASATVDIGPGDVLLIDNDLVVHGRAAFTPRYDGTDRWLKRILLHLDRQRPAADARAEHWYDRPILTASAGKR